MGHTIEMSVPNTTCSQSLSLSLSLLWLLVPNSPKQTMPYILPFPAHIYSTHHPAILIPSLTLLYACQHLIPFHSNFRVFIFLIKFDSVLDSNKLPFHLNSCFLGGLKLGDGMVPKFHVTLWTTLHYYSLVWRNSNCFFAFLIYFIYICPQ